jgi:hypothetical protein
VSLTAHLPASFEAERRHAVALVIEDILGLAVDVVAQPGTGSTTIRAGDGTPQRLDIADGFFTMAPDAWLDASSLPAEPLRWCDAAALPADARLCEPRLPLLFGEPGPAWSPRHDGASLGVDVFGAAFFLATRYEEAVQPVYDSHGRYSSTASLLHRAGLLHRPLLDEYAEILWAAMHHVWPRLRRPTRRFRVVSTHDVDHPFQLLNSGTGGMMREAASRLRRGDPRSALLTPLQWRRVQRDGVAHDPGNIFAEIMDADEAANAQAAFYFMTDPDPIGRISRRRYRIDDPAISALLRSVHGRGHEIGIHPSYNAHLDAVRLGAELAALRTRCSQLEIEQPQWGGRFHYLRWDARRSPAMWSGAGLAYDSSVGFAEAPGFRAGTCHPHHMWDHDGRRRLDSLERPLIVMDISLTAPKYLGLRADAAADRICALKRACQTVDGEFVVLWHNDILTDPQHWELYLAAIDSH